MLQKEILDQFTKEANKWRNQFCVRMYTNNSFAEYTKNKAHPKYYSENPSYFNKPNSGDIVLQGTIIPSLQHWRVLSVARLIDPAYFRWDKNKPRLSIYYILELLDKETLKEETETILDTQKEYFESIKNIRDNMLAHNSTTRISKEIKAGTELFFDNLNKTLIKIKNEFPELKQCNDLNLKNTEKLSELGVKEIFEKII